MQKYSDTVLDRNGNVVVGATVTVTTYPAGTSATVYSSDAVGSNANPLTTDSNGYFEFWAANGQYSLSITKTGITTRTVNNILIQDTVVSVTEYGAKGDGATDDRAAIQAAHDAIYAAGGGTVFFPPGTYLVGATTNGSGRCAIAFRDYVRFKGSGRGATIIRLASGANVTGSHSVFEPYNYGTTLPAIGYYSRYNTFEHFSIDGNIAGNAGKSYEGISAAQVKDCFLYAVEAYSCGECGFLLQAANTGTDQKTLISAVNCTAHDNTADGFQLVGASVTNCWSYSNSGAGFDSVGNLVSGNADNLITMITGCRADYNAQGGIVSVLQTGPHIRTIITGCTAHYNTNNGIAVNMKYTSVSNCDVAFNTTDGIDCGADFCTITGGKSMNNGTSAVGATNYRSGVKVTGTRTYCVIQGVICTDDQGGPTQQYAFAFTAPGSGSNNRLVGCIASGNVNALPYQLTSATDWRIEDNNGINPIGPFNGAAAGIPSNPAVPASTVTQTNSYSYRVFVAITGGTVTAIKINTVATGLIAGSFVLGPGETISITYTVAPTWQWFGL